MELIDAEFTDLLGEDIQLPSWPVSFFDLTGLRFSEKVFSNLYAYYLNPTGEHGMRDLFLNALCSLIQEKTGQPSLQNMMWAVVQKEVCTDAGNFIDLVVIEPEEGSSQPGHALIIENKMNANLYNNLIDYFNHVKVSGRKIGIVLSIRKEKPNHPNYINITHGELIARVVSGLPAVFVELDTRQLFLIKELIAHIQSYYMSQDLSSQYAFYFKYEDKIRAISKLEQMIRADLFSQLGVACERLGLKLGAPYHSTLRYFYSQTCPVCFTVIMTDLFTPQHKLLIIVEMNKQGMDHLDNINQIKFTDNEKEIIKETTRVRTTYLHYAVKSFLVASEEMQDFGSYICKKIKETPLYSIFTKIENCMLSNALLGEPKD